MIPESYQVVPANPPQENDWGWSFAVFLGVPALIAATVGGVSGNWLRLLVAGAPLLVYWTAIIMRHRAIAHWGGGALLVLYADLAVRFLIALDHWITTEFIL